MRIALVVAVAQNGVIGKDGGLAWRIADDMRYFKATTLGKPVIMGRKTWDSIGKPLPGRINIVVSRTADAIDGAIVARSPEAALRHAEEAAIHLDADEICVIGGAEIYRALLPAAGRIYLTEVDAAPEGDAHFPPFAESGWSRRLVGAAATGDKNEHACQFFILDRRNTSPETAG
jgi:dihydrofolate reductase